jgi:hypothetical protein
MKQGYQLPGSYSFIEPMKALTVQALPVGRWIYEVKFDGYRALGFKNGKETRLVSRNQKDFTRFRELNAALNIAACRTVYHRWRDCRPGLEWEVFFPASASLRNR